MLLALVAAYYHWVWRLVSAPLDRRFAENMPSLSQRHDDGPRRPRASLRARERSYFFFPAAAGGEQIGSISAFSAVTFGSPSSFFVASSAS